MSQIHTAPSWRATLTVGDEASSSRTVAESDILRFAEVSGDANPLHLDEEYARGTRFRGRIAHGMLTASWVSAVLGCDLPGVGCIFQSLTVKFRLPVKIGDWIRTTVRVAAIGLDPRRVTLAVSATNQSDDVVMDGEAVLVPPPDTALLPRMAAAS